MSEPRISEPLALRMLQTTINEGRCAEFVECMWNGGSATVDATTGALVLISGDQLWDLVPVEDVERNG